MVEGEEVLFRPVFEHMYPSTALEDGSIDLAHVMLCNEAIDIRNENDRRGAEYEMKQREKGGRR